MPESRLNMFESRSIRSSIKKIKITKKFLILLLILIMCLCAKKKKKQKKNPRHLVTVAACSFVNILSRLDEHYFFFAK